MGNKTKNVNLTHKIQKENNYYSNNYTYFVIDFMGWVFENLESETKLFRISKYSNKSFLIFKYQTGLKRLSKTSAELTINI